MGIAIDLLRRGSSRKLNQHKQMSIRLPLQKVLDQNNSTEVGSGPASTAGGIGYTFNLPQDTDNVVVKFTASVLAGGVSATLQTTDDGGTTWYDVARTSIVSNANGTTAEWISAPVSGTGIGATVPNQTSVVGFTNTGIVLNGIGSAAASSLGVKQNSGLPILSQRGRVFLRYSNAVTSVINERVIVMANSQSATA